MRKRNVVKLFIIISIFFIGCSTTKPTPYSFTGNEGEAATITVVGGNPGLQLIFCDGIELPIPEKKRHWDPITVSAGKPLIFTLRAFYHNNNASGGLLTALIVSAISASTSVNAEVIYECPPLEAGKHYQFSFRKGAGVPGLNSILITEGTGKKGIVFREYFFTL